MSKRRIFSGTVWVSALLRGQFCSIFSVVYRFLRPYVQFFRLWVNCRVLPGASLANFSPNRCSFFVCMQISLLHFTHKRKFCSPRPCQFHTTAIFAQTTPCFTGGLWANGFCLSKWTLRLAPVIFSAAPLPEKAPFCGSDHKASAYHRGIALCLWSSCIRPVDLQKL
ncbi:hypothetical protein SDC9_151987 [bioreactor metagenome]|uniref:Uncharacterized protein n=1 Tax=bioreactor metagenome TaxID=1076179 RepID=A0A645ETJ1_9ZZZZ